jgi:hypothetical protein
MGKTQSLPGSRIVRIGSLALAWLLALSAGAATPTGTKKVRPPTTLRLGENRNDHVVPRGETHEFDGNRGRITVEEGGHALIHGDNRGELQGSGEIRGDNRGQFFGTGEIHGSNRGQFHGSGEIHGTNRGQVSGAIRVHGSSAGTEGVTINMGNIGNFLGGVGNGVARNVTLGGGNMVGGGGEMTINGVTLRSQGTLSTGTTTGRGVRGIRVGGLHPITIEKDGASYQLSRDTEGNIVIEHAGAQRVVADSARHQAVDLEGSVVTVGDERIELESLGVP